MSKTDWEKLAAALRFRASASPITLSTAVEFLEADPWFHSSGYIKAKLIKFINRQELKPDWVRRLQKVVIASVTAKIGVSSEVIVGWRVRLIQRNCAGN